MAGRTISRRNFTGRLFNPALSYTILLPWWVEQNAKGRHLWPGNYVDKVDGTPTGWPAQELLDQIALTRAQRGATGNVYFTAWRTLMYGRDGLPEKLVAGPYATRALVPASTWLDSVPPSPPIVACGPRCWNGREYSFPSSRRERRLPGCGDRAHVGNDWSDRNSARVSRDSSCFRAMSGEASRMRLVCQAVDRNGNESTPVLLGGPHSSLATICPSRLRETELMQ